MPSPWSFAMRLARPMARRHHEPWKLPCTCPITGIRHGVSRGCLKRLNQEPFANRAHLPETAEILIYSDKNDNGSVFFSRSDARSLEKNTSRESLSPYIDQRFVNWTLWQDSHAPRTAQISPFWFGMLWYSCLRGLIQRRPHSCGSFEMHLVVQRKRSRKWGFFFIVKASQLLLYYDLPSRSACGNPTLFANVAIKSVRCFHCFKWTYCYTLISQ